MKNKIKKIQLRHVARYMLLFERVWSLYGIAANLLAKDVGQTDD
jgi:hypothetical protein